MNMFSKKQLCVYAYGLSIVLLFITGNTYGALNKTNASQLTLKSAIKRTLTNQPQLHEFEIKRQIIDGETKTAALNPAYALGLDVENVLGTGEISGIKEAELTLSLSSVIELGDKVHARIQAVEVKRQQLLVERQVRTLDVLAEVTRRYIEVLASQEMVKAFNDAEQLARDAYQAVNRRVDAGASPFLEQKRAEAALAEARLGVETAKQQLQSNIKSLAIMWGEQQPLFSLVQGDLFTLPASSEFRTLITSLSASPYIQLFAEHSRVQEAQVQLSQASNKPDITWSAGIRRMNGIDETAFVAGASVPLFTQRRNLGEYEAQKAKLEQIELQKQISLRNLYHQVNQSLDARNRALLEVTTLQKSIIPPLQEALTLVEKAYSEGRFSYLEWVSTRKELLSAQHSLIQSAKQAHQRTADIEALTGLSILSYSSRAALNSNYEEK